jgi:hypothetical protein
MNEKETKELLDKVEQAVNLLSDHFECVQILCSNTEDGDTNRYERGIGNIFARTKQAQSFAEFHSNADMNTRMDEFYGVDNTVSLTDDDDEDNEGWKKI